MKKYLISVLSVLLIICILSANVSAEDKIEYDNQYNETVYSMGDVNADGAVDSVDGLKMLEILTKQRNAFMQYELADLNGDIRFDVKDLLLLKKLLANHEVQLNNSCFNEADTDVTAELEDLGINNIYRWNDSEKANILARNPFDMLSYGNKVLVSGGNYQDNKGPVSIYAYTRETNKGVTAGQLDTEQINRFSLYDNMVFTVSIDSRQWGAASIYTISSTNSVFFKTSTNVLVDDIHCYDIAKYDGTYFYAGSSVKYDSNYKNYSGTDVEMSQSIIYRFTGTDITKCKSSDFVEVELVNRFGDVVDYYSHLRKSTKSDGTEYYYTTGVPRIYDFFEFDGEFYALYYNQYSDWYDEAYELNGKYNFNGFYKYDDEKGQFIYDGTKSIDYLTKLFDEAQDYEKISHDFAWKNNYYFIARGLHTTTDFAEYKEVNLKEYSNYTVKDAIVRNSKVYLLCTKLKTDGTYINYVLETVDFNSFRPILHFDSFAFARSFEFCNGAFFFGLGTTTAEYSTECGRIFRYNYYK